MTIHSRSFSRWLAALSCAGAALLQASSALANDENQHATAWRGGNEYQRSIRSYVIPDVVLTDADARPVRLQKLLAADGPVMLNFIFTTCGTICPIMVKVFADVPSRLGAAGKNLTLVSVSIDPENDTPAKLKSYANNSGTGARWTFLTGSLKDIKTVQLAFDSYRGDKMSHEPLTLMRLSPGKPWVRIDGFANPDELALEYRRATQQ